MAVIEQGRLGRRAYCPYGPTVVSKDALNEALTSLKTQAKSFGVDFLRVEPQGPVSTEDLESLGLLHCDKDHQPADTAICDVTISPDEIVARSKQAARNLYRRNLREGVEISTSYDIADLDDFLRLIHQVAERTGMIPFPDSYFRSIAAALFTTRNAGLLLARKDGKVIASLIFYRDETTMIYAHAAADDDYRKLSPATALLMQAQIEAHNAGCTSFDFFGIAPEGADSGHPWSGFTSFKMSFGPERVHYLGTWELPIHPLRYKLYHSVLGLTSRQDKNKN